MVCCLYALFYESVRWHKKIYFYKQSGGAQCRAGYTGAYVVKQ